MSQTDSGLAASRSALGWVAILLAVGISTALNVLVFASVYVAIAGKSDVPGGLSENATQVLTGWGGGMIGVLGAFVGYRAGQEQSSTRTSEREETS
jgi:hypothetical protein